MLEEFPENVNPEFPSKVKTLLSVTSADLAFECIIPTGDGIDPKLASLSLIRELASP
ncbi:hypothetical protein CPC1998_1072, partial [Chlamydia psittaci C19/98]